MSGVQTRGLLEITPEQNDGEAKQDLHQSKAQHRANEATNKQTYDAVVERVPNPKPESGFGEERIALTEHIQLRVPIQYPGRDELIEDANDKGG